MLQYLNKRRKKGQSTLEYAILVIIIIGALIAIQVYIKRGVQGRLKSAADDIGDQFSPGNTNVMKVTRTVSQTSETFQNGVSNSALLRTEQNTTNYSANIVNIEQEYWGG